MNSIYNNLNKSKKLWTVNKNLMIKDLKDIIDRQTIKIKSKKSKTLKKKNFILTNDSIYYIKNEKIKGHFNYNFIGLNYNNTKKKIILFNNFKYFALNFENLRIYKKWKKIFKSKCVLNNFHKKFIFLKNLGAGANSVVKLSKNLNNNKLFAIKIIKKTENINSLVNEINILKKLNHKNITKFYGLYESHNNFLVILEYCNFLTLKSYLKINKNLGKKDKINLINQILEGLNYIHSENIVHRDLKPDNIFLHKNEKNEIVIKIGDFGIANFLDKEFIFKRCGTPGFIAPEILKYEKEFDYNITTKVDIYSSGHLIYNILTNSFLFEFESIQELIFRNQNNIYNIKNDLNNPWKKIIECCLIKNPDLRINIISLKKLVSKI